jgi:hypothetical protein
MTYKGVVKERTIVLVGDEMLSEGTSVEVIPELETQVPPKTDNLMARLWATTHKILNVSGMTSDSVEILRELREERAD